MPTAETGLCLCYIFCFLTNVFSQGNNFPVVIADSLISFLVVIHKRFYNNFNRNDEWNLFFVCLSQLSIFHAHKLLVKFWRESLLIILNMNIISWLVKYHWGLTLLFDFLIYEYPSHETKIIQLGFCKSKTVILCHYLINNVYCCLG